MPRLLAAYRIGYSIHTAHQSRPCICPLADCALRGKLSRTTYQRGHITPCSCCLLTLYGTLTRANIVSRDEAWNEFNLPLVGGMADLLRGLLSYPAHILSFFKLWRNQGH